MMNYGLRRRWFSSSYWSSPMTTMTPTTTMTNGMMNSMIVPKYLFDTSKFVIGLEQQGYNREQSEGIMKLLYEVLQER
jgi:hypothetical protein